MTNIKHETKQNTSHTPGPWHQEGQNLFAEDGTCLCRLATTAELPANARLITAAPKLLAACEATEQCIVDFIDVYKRGCSMLILDEAVKSLRDDALRLVRKALAEATDNSIGRVA